MADKEKKEAVAPSDGWQKFADSFFWVLLVLVALSFLGMMFGNFDFNLSLPDAAGVSSFIFNQVQVFSIFFSLVFFVGILYCNYLTSALSSHHAGSRAHVQSLSHPQAPREPDKRWQDIINKLNSPSEGDWRVAIIEADIILDDMLNRMGYFGEGVAEKLKQVEASDFRTIDSAWEAHKVRNNIAHGGSSFHLSKRQAEKTISQFKEVFEEFYFI